MIILTRNKNKIVNIGCFIASIKLPPNKLEQADKTISELLATQKTKNVEIAKLQELVDYLELEVEDSKDCKELV